jgi:hypothetical protein
MRRLRRFLSTFAVVLATSCAIAEPADTPRRVPANLFPDAEQVWLYSEPPQPADEVRGAPINAGPRFRLTDREVQQLRDAVYELDLKTVAGDVVVGDLCIHSLKYVFGFEDLHGKNLGFFGVYVDMDRPMLYPSGPYRRNFLLLVDRPMIEEIAAHHLTAQVIASLGERRHCA